ncbi:hypothetical protein KUCAC02_031677, partial [Chaenocephalus aceratus]
SRSLSPQHTARLVLCTIWSAQREGALWEEQICVSRHGPVGCQAAAIISATPWPPAPLSSLRTPPS